MAVDAVSVVVPVFQSEFTLAELVDRVSSVMTGGGHQFELILVNDGSTDSSWQEISRLAREVPQVRGLDLMRNFGQHNALLSGIRAARFPIIVTLDDDLQHPPEEIPKLLDALEPGVEVVYGTPTRERHSGLRRVASRTTKLALRQVMAAETAEHVSAFRAFRTHLRAAFDEYRSSVVSIDVLLTWATKSFKWVSVEHAPRKEGESNYRLSSLITHALNMVTGFSVRPLQLASLLGLAFTTVGGLFLVYILASFFIKGPAVPGFTFLAASLAIFSGIQLFCLGIIGEYLARMHTRVSERPAYVVRMEIGSSPAQDKDHQPRGRRGGDRK